MLILTPEGLHRHHIGAPELKGVLLFFVFLTGSIGSVQSSVAENPHHRNIKGVGKVRVYAGLSWLGWIMQT